MRTDSDVADASSSEAEQEFSGCGISKRFAARELTTTNFLGHRIEVRRRIPYDSKPRVKNRCGEELFRAAPHSRARRIGKLSDFCVQDGIDADIVIGYSDYTCESLAYN